MFRKADPDHMLSSGTTYVRIIEGEQHIIRLEAGRLGGRAGEDHLDQSAGALVEL